MGQGGDDIQRRLEEKGVEAVGRGCKAGVLSKAWEGLEESGAGDRV